MLVCAVVLAACSTATPATARGDGVAPTSSTTAPGTAGTSGVQTAPSTLQTTTSTVASGLPAQLPSSGPAVNLAVSSADMAALEAAYSSYTQVPSADIAGAEPGSAHEAWDPATRTFWATAKFSPTPSAAQYAAAFQDGGDIGIFTRSQSGSWTMTRAGGEPFPCPVDFPADVQAVWGFTASPYCSS